MCADVGLQLDDMYNVDDEDTFLLKSRSMLSIPRWSARRRDATKGVALSFSGKHTNHEWVRYIIHTSIHVIAMALWINVMDCNVFVDVFCGVSSVEIRVVAIQPSTRNIAVMKRSMEEHVLAELSDRASDLRIEI